MCFLTSTATLEVHHDTKHHYGSPAPQISRDELVLDTLWSHKPQMSFGKVIEQVKFIVVGRESVEDIRDHVQLFTLMADEDDNGVLYRRGMAVVNETQWVTLNNRVWEIVSLGSYAR